MLDLEQGTPEWHEWRRHGIGASEAATIMGENPWRTPEQHLAARCRTRKPKPASPAMALGTALEPEARLAFEMAVSTPMVPLCLQSIRCDWLRASLDGMSIDGRRVVEIKCGRRVYQEAAMFRRVPRNYMAQLQHILVVTGLPEIDFWCYWPECDPVHLRTPRDELYIRRLIAVEESFWQRVVRMRYSPSQAGASTSAV